MNETKIIAPGEAWEAVERLRIDIHPPVRNDSKWLTIVHEPPVRIGWGDTPLEAVGNLLARIADEQAKAIPGGV